MTIWKNPHTNMKNFRFFQSTMLKTAGKWSLWASSFSYLPHKSSVSKNVKLMRMFFNFIHSYVSAYFGNLTIGNNLKKKIIPYKLTTMIVSNGKYRSTLFAITLVKRPNLKYLEFAFKYEIMFQIFSDLTHISK